MRVGNVISSIMNSTNFTLVYNNRNSKVYITSYIYYNTYYPI